MKKLLLFASVLVTQFTSAQWEQLPGPYGSEIFTVQLTENQIFAGGYSLFATVPNTSKWTTRHTIVDDGMSSSYSVNNVIYFCSTTGLLYTNDYGYSYQKVPNIPAAGGAGNSYLAGRGDTIYYKGNGVYRSFDAGNTWAYVNNDPYLSTAFGYDGKNLYTCYGNQIVVSANKGVSFQAMPSVIYQQYQTAYDFYRMGNSFFWAGAKGLGVTKDFGATWARSGTTAFDTSVIRAITEMQGVLIIGTDSLIYFSTDSGTTWSAPTHNFGQSKITDLCAKDSLLCVATYDGVYLSTDTGKTFNHIVIDMSALQVGRITKANDKMYPFQIGQFSADGGLSWQPTTPDSLIFLYVLEHNTNICAIAKNAITGTPAFYFSSNNGVSWQKRTNGLPAFNSSTTISDFKIHNDIIYFSISSSSMGMYSTSNDGLNWQSDNNGLSGLGLIVYAITFCDTSAFISNAQGIYTKNNGTWQLVNSGAVTYMACQSPVIVASSGNGTFYKSTDKGVSWSNISITPTQTVYDINISAGKLFAGTRNGVYMTPLDTVSWRQVNYGFFSDFAVSLYSDSSYLYAGTTYYGLWRRKLSDFDHQINVSGVVFSDDNNNHIADSTEQKLSNVIISASSCNYFTNTDTNGVYSFILDCDSSVISIPNPPRYTNSIYPTNYFITADDSAADFAINRLQGVNDLQLDIEGMVPARPGHDVDAYVTIFNTGTTTLSGNVMVTVFDTANLSYKSSSQSPFVFPDDTLKWNFSNLLPNHKEIIQVTYAVDSHAVAQSPVNLYGIVNPLTGDSTPNDNYAVKIAQVVQSVDPNFKEVQPGNTISTNFIDSGLPLVYVIHFQNTGNYPAYHISIKDTLDENLDVSTFELVSSSHEVSFTLVNNVVTFYFNNILLPDSSSNESQSHGFVKYRIKPKHLNLGDQVKNTCSIKFDLNEPLQTNTTTTTVTSFTSIPLSAFEKNSLVVLFPNPANNQLSLVFPDNLIGNQISIYSITGTLMQSIKPETAITKLDIVNYPSGVYIAEVRLNGAVERVKWIKM